MEEEISFNLKEQSGVNKIKLYKCKFSLYCILSIKTRCKFLFYFGYEIYLKKKSTTGCLLSISPSVNPPTHPFALLICPSSHLAVDGINKVSALQREQPL